MSLLLMYRNAKLEIWLLWNYEVIKAKKDYASDNDDPLRPWPSYLPPLDESEIVNLE